MGEEEAEEGRGQVSKWMGHAVPRAIEPHIKDARPSASLTLGRKAYSISKGSDARMHLKARMQFVPTTNLV